MIIVKLCMIVVLIELYPIIPLSVNWFCFKVTAVSNSFNRKSYVLIWISLNFVQLFIMSGRLWIYHCLIFSHVQGRWLTYFLLQRKPLIWAFFSYTIKARSLKLWIIIILPRVYTITLGFYDLVSRSQVCQEYKVQISCFGFLSSVL